MAYNDGEQAKLKKQKQPEFYRSGPWPGRWREAIAANQTILEIFPADVEALEHRLGRAHMELGEYKRSPGCLQEVQGPPTPITASPTEPAPALR